MDSKEAELRRRINENLIRIRSGVYRRQAASKPKKDKRSELERATPEEIQSGFIVLEARRIRKELHRLLRDPDLKGPELDYAEELQCQLDDYDAALEAHTNAELRRYVRLWNKSRKVKYAV